MKNFYIKSCLEEYGKKKAISFHMPGHKGKSRLGFEKCDITEIHGADVLYSPNGIIEESENNASRLFGTAHTFYSAEGSSLSVRAMLALASAGKKNATVLAARNVHKSFVYACALLDLNVEWIFPKEYTHPADCHITPDDVKEILDKCDVLPCAVYVTSPNYLGRICDVESIAKVCHGFGVPLLVDNAHGAYLAFTEINSHPIALGADMCCDSAHKTLPVITGGAYLHVSKNADEKYVRLAREKLELFASTSPSYLILQSLDLCNQYLDSDFPSELKTCIEKLDAIKDAAVSLGVVCLDGEKLKLVIDICESGLTKRAVLDAFRQNSVEAELCDEEFAVIMASPDNTDEDFIRLLSAVATLSYGKTKAQKKTDQLKAVRPERVTSIRDAIFASHEKIPTQTADGRICADCTVSCPPAVPIVICGERIDEDTKNLLIKYGIDQITVIKS